MLPERFSSGCRDLYGCQLFPLIQSENILSAANINETQLCAALVSIGSLCSSLLSVGYSSRSNVNLLENAVSVELSAFAHSFKWYFRFKTSMILLIFVFSSHKTYFFLNSDEYPHTQSSQSFQGMHIDHKNCANLRSFDQFVKFQFWILNLSAYLDRSISCECGIAMQQNWIASGE